MMLGTTNNKKIEYLGHNSNKTKELITISAQTVTKLKQQYLFIRNLMTKILKF